MTRGQLGEAGCSGVKQRGFVGYFLPFGIFNIVDRFFKPVAVLEPTAGRHA